MEVTKELIDALAKALEEAVIKYVADGGKIEDLDWFSYKPIERNPCLDIPNLDCQYKGCEKSMIGFDSRYGHRYCEDHRNILPVNWEHKDNG